MFEEYLSVYVPVWYDPVFGKNTYGDVFSAILLFLFSYFGLFVLRSIVLAKLKGLSKRTTTDVDDRVIASINSINPIFYLFIAVFVGLQALTFDGLVGKIVDGITIAIIVMQSVILLQHVVDFFIQRKMNSTTSTDDAFVASAMMQISRFVLWILALLFVLSNIGVNITSLVAGLGVGGVAVALAAQNVLSDLLSYFSIYFDKPFKVGDFIIVGQQLGTVERVGVVSTRIRSLSGEEIIIPNKELASERIQNYGRMYERRVVFNFGVEYGTSKQQLMSIVELVKDIVMELGKIRFDRVHFMRFGDSSLDFEVVYYVLDPDYNVYMDLHQQILLAIKEKVEGLGVGFAFPTRTVHLIQ